MPAVARVLVDSPIPRLDRLLDYAIPPRLTGQLVVGARVKVPLGRGSRIVDAFVVELAGSSESGTTLAEVEDVCGTTPVLTPNLWRLVRAVADRNGGNATDVLRSVIPKRAVRIDKQATISPQSLTTAGSGVRRVLALDSGVDGPAEHVTRRGYTMIAGRVRRVIEEGKTAIVVVPDWRDLELMMRAVGGVAPTVRWDSSGTPSERYARYLEVLSGSARIIVGTRSAVFAPVEDVGLIVVVDDSDPLHVEQIAPYVNARDVAVLRNEFEGGELLFAGYAPSVETARYRDLGFAENDPHQPERPRIVLANDSADFAAANTRIPSAVWRRIKETVATRPVLVLVARPGFTPQILCAQCHSTFRCVRCSSILAAKRSGAPSCRVCGHTHVSYECASCHGRRWIPSGNGSERTALELGKAFPGVNVMIADANHRHLEIAAKPSLVVATRGAEPIVAGGYGAVVILDADRELQNPSLRTTENCVRWWSSAAALVADDGEVLLSHVTGGFGALFATGMWERIIEDELRERRALGFPPANRTLTVTGSIAEITALRELIAPHARTILGPISAAEGHRIIVLCDLKHHREVVTLIRGYIVSASKTTIRLRCDDMSAFDSFDES
ncbi:MAG: hypothetical protein ACKOWP_03370 [Microbacteriaceae bacterium]